MKEVKGVIFTLLLTLSIILTIQAFDYADSMRAIHVTGGEIFLIIFPAGICLAKAQHEARKNERLKRRLKKQRGF